MYPKWIDYVAALIAALFFMLFFVGAILLINFIENKWCQV